MLDCITDETGKKLLSVCCNASSNRNILDPFVVFAINRTELLDVSDTAIDVPAGSIAAGIPVAAFVFSIIEYASSIANCLMRLSVTLSIPIIGRSELKEPVVFDAIPMSVSSNSISPSTRSPEEKRVPAGDFLRRPSYVILYFVLKLATSDSELRLVSVRI